MRLIGALFGLSAALGACTQTTEVVTASVPANDYRLRHPIAVTEANHSIVVFVGHARGGLSGPQRTDVMGLAQTWVREGTGAIVADVPVDTPNARAAAASYREIHSVLMAGGVPSRAITLRHYHPDDPRTAVDDQAELSEDFGGGRPLRPVAGRSRTEHRQQRLQREPPLPQFRLRHPAQPRCDDRQSVRSRTAAPRDACLHPAPQYRL